MNRVVGKRRGEQAHVQSRPFQDMGRGKKIGWPEQNYGLAWVRRVNDAEDTKQLAKALV